MLVTLAQKIKFLQIVAALKSEEMGVTNVQYAFLSITNDIFPSQQNKDNVLSALGFAIGLKGKLDSTDEVFTSQYEAANYVDYIETFNNEGLKQRHLDLAITHTTPEDLQAYTNAASSLKWIGFNFQETVAFILKIDDERLALVSKQCSDMFDSVRNFKFEIGHYGSNENLEAELELIMSGDDTPEVETSLPLKKTWTHHDLLSEDYKNNLRLEARFYRLCAIHGEVEWKDQAIVYEKLKDELVIADIIANPNNPFNDRFRNFMMDFSTGISLFAVAMDQIDNHKPITDFKAPTNMKTDQPVLTSDVGSLRQVIAKFKSRHLLPSDSADVDFKLAVLEANWPTIATQRVLNPDFNSYSYVNMPHTSYQYPDPDTHQRTGNNNGLIVTGSLLLSIVLVCYFRDNLARMFGGIGRGVSHGLSTLGLMRTSNPAKRIDFDVTEEERQTFSL